MNVALASAYRTPERGVLSALGAGIMFAVTLTDAAWRRTVAAVKRFESYKPRQKKEVTRRPNAPDFRFFMVMSEGPSAEADFSDERYYVQLAQLTNSDDDPTSKLTFAVIADTDARYLYASATNLAEWVGETHNLASGAIVPVFTAYSSESIGTPRRFFNFPA